jgi:hypothetical protein
MVPAFCIDVMIAERPKRRYAMRARGLLVPLIATLFLGTVSCYYHSHYYPPRGYYARPAAPAESPPAAGYRLYSEAPRFPATDPARVSLLKGEPKRELVRLGEVWIRPSSTMDRYYVEGVLRDKAAGMGADALVIVTDGTTSGGDRRIVGVAIRYKR